MTTSRFAYEPNAHVTEHPQPEPMDRREWVRFPSNMEAICWEPFEQGGEPWAAFVRDISAGGIGLLARQQLEPGQTFNLKIHSNHISLSGVLEAEVTSAKPQGPDVWIIGCRFTNPLGEYERRILL